ncbi:hypothetical protein BGZ96_011716 [Linnemannia gamsii]|uniref:Zinc/iron permease n=1 Tax=Linnemannia gamsii TaxID=64522 RepID=A0ABQ7KBR2_9FUNG|nr:hypothetical protein BGZ96_011716 [Linnemannia gamsii]
MRLSLPCRITALSAVILLATLAPSTLAQDSALLSNNNNSGATAAAEHYIIAKRAGEDDHDHDHPPATTTVAPITPGATSSGAITGPTTAPTHDHAHDGHDHDHDHAHEEEGHDHDHAEAEAGHSHGPARTCEAHDHDHGEYVVWHHIVALIVLMVVAGLGCVLPMIIPETNRTRFFVQLGKYFGAGVVLSVAFVHILPEALFALTHPFSTYMLELGIALHSIFIGIALGVLAGSEFLAMTIAICFHQFFEGVALGSRIADLTFKKKWLPAVLVLIFALVTPFGMAIGMGMRSGYRANSVENLIITGICNSIACGVLLYTAFVTLLGGDILYSERFRAESKKHKASYLVAVWLGALAMAVIALWA